MRTRRSAEGYLLIDHSASPGLTEGFARQFGMPVVAEGQKFESGTLDCAHCQRTVVLNAERERPRGHCWACDSYICDECGVAAQTLGCQNFNAKLEELGERLLAGGNHG